MANLPQVLFLWRRHDDSITFTRNEKQRTNAFLISQQYISELLGRSVPMERIRLLWERKADDIGNAMQLSWILLELYQVVVSDNRWTRQEKQLLQKYVSLKLFNYIRPHIRDKRTWEIAVRLFILSPALYRQMLVSKTLKTLKLLNA